VWVALLVVGAIAVVVTLVAATRERTEPCAPLEDARAVVVTPDSAWTLSQARYRVQPAVNRHLFTGLQLRLPEGVFATVTLTPVDASGRPLENGALLSNVQSECIRLTHGGAAWQTRLHEGERSHRLIAGAGPGPQWPMDDRATIIAWVRADGQLYELQLGEIVIGGAYF
jgi:hypothetical protein